MGNALYREMLDLPPVMVVKARRQQESKFQWTGLKASTARPASSSIPS